MNTRAQVGGMDDGNTEGSRSTWTVRRGGVVREIPASNKLDPGMARSRAHGESSDNDGRTRSGRDSGGRRQNRGRGTGSLHRGASGPRKRWQPQQGRPMPQQIMLNQRIAACMTIEDVFSQVTQAREDGIPLLSTRAPF